MDAVLVTAIVRHDMAEKVEQKLIETGIAGIGLSRIKWYGEYPDFYSRDGLVEYVKLEVFTESARAEAIATAIMEAAHTGLRGDGIVSISPVTRIYRIRTRAEVTGERLWQ